MNTLILGGLGFVGRRLSQHLLTAGHSVTAVGLRREPTGIDHPRFHYRSADSSRPGEWQQLVPDARLVVNLAGKSIFHLWTRGYKQKMRQSRIHTTRHVVDALPTGGDTLLLNASAVGYYGDGGETVLTEDMPPGTDFPAKMSLEWEAEALKAEAKQIRVVIARFGIVLDADGGAMDLLVNVFKSFAGGRLGSGRQWFPWIHMADLIRACRFVMNAPDFRGVFNFCAPEPVRNSELTRTLAAALHRPAMLPAPAFLIRRLMGGFGKMLLNSQRAVPRRLLEHGFTFRYPTLETAVAEIVARRNKAAGD